MDPKWLNSMNDIKSDATSGKADLKLSADVQHQYISTVHAFRDVLTAQLDKINGLPAYGDPGTLQSAQQTKANLQSGCNEVKRVINDYVKYLDAYVDTVVEAGKRLTDADNSG